MKNIGKYTFFYKDKLSQWTRSLFEDLKGNIYVNVEQYMMAKKALLFNDLEIYNLIMNEESPKIIKDYGRKVKNFDEAIWIKHREKVIYDGNYLRFSQDENSLQLLLSTGDNILVEASKDSIYGIGLTMEDPNIADESKWIGLNLLGKALMLVRKQLKLENENEKYNRTEHLSFSEEKHADDKTMNKAYEDNLINNEEIIVSIKMDGGNTCMDKNGIYARTHSQVTTCPTFDYIKNKHYYPKLSFLNEDYKYFGENMYAKHSIEYNELTDYFYLFNIKNIKTNTWLSYDELLEEAKRLDFNFVPVVFVGKTNTKDLKLLIKEVMKDKFFGGEVEGVVIRNKNSFHNDDWEKNVGKFVRNGHVQTDEHWSKNLIKNNLIKKGK